MDREKVVELANDIRDSIHEKPEQTILDYKTYSLCIQVLKLLKEQEAKPVEVCGQMFTVKYGHCPTCGKGMDSDTYPHWCGFCGQAVKWE